MKYTFAGCIVAFAATMGGANAATLNFEGVTTSGGLNQQGAIAGTEIPGVTITLGGSGADTLGLYDSSCRTDCTGGDADLATGSGIVAISPGNTNQQAQVDTPEEGFILISAEGSGASFGDRVGSPVFSFAFDTPSFIDSFVLVDIDENPANVSVTFNFADGGASLGFDGTAATTVLNAGRNNSWSEFVVADIAANLALGGLLNPVSSFDIAFDDISGGVASIHATPVPVPAALPMLLGGLGMLGWVSRRRKAA